MPMIIALSVAFENATDSAMIIDAMDVLYGGNVDGFVLVSDSDYTRLAVRLRESGRFSARYLVPRATVVSLRLFTSPRYL